MGGEKLTPRLGVRGTPGAVHAYLAGQDLLWILLALCAASREEVGAVVPPVTAGN